MEKGEMGENATGRLATYYVAECMEFNRYGEYREDIHSAEEAVKIYHCIDSVDRFYITMYRYHKV